MPVKLINTDLEDGALEVANWILKEPSELREVGDDTLLMFISHYDLQEFFDLVEKHTYEYWVDGTTTLEYNGGDYVIEIDDILRHFDIDRAMIIKAYNEDED